jgi:hypothetical protein
MRVVQQVERRDAVDRGDPQVSVRKAKRPDRTLRALIRRPVNVAVAHTHDGLRIDLIRQAQPGCDVVRIPVVLISAVAIHGDEHDAASQVRECRHAIGQRRSRHRIEIVHPVVSLCARHGDVVPAARD